MEPLHAQLEEMKARLRLAWQEHGVTEVLQNCFESCVYRLSRRKVASFIRKEMELLQENKATVQLAQQAVQLREASLSSVRELAAHLELISDEELQTVGEDCAELLETHRVLCLSAVESIVKWREGLVFALLLNNTAESYQMAKKVVFTWEGVNYLVKMKSDTDFLKLSSLGRLFNFSTKHDPFLVIPANFKVYTSEVDSAYQGDGRMILNLPAVILSKVRLAELVLMAENEHDGEKPAPTKPKIKDNPTRKASGDLEKAKRPRRLEAKTEVRDKPVLRTELGLEKPKKAKLKAKTETRDKPSLKTELGVDKPKKSGITEKLRELEKPRNKMRQKLEVKAEARDEVNIFITRPDSETLFKQEYREVAPLILDDLVEGLTRQLEAIAREAKQDLDRAASALHSVSICDSLVSRAVDKEIKEVIEGELHAIPLDEFRESVTPGHSTPLHSGSQSASPTESITSFEAVTYARDTQALDASYEESKQRPSRSYQPVITVTSGRSEFKQSSNVRSDQPITDASGRSELKQSSSNVRSDQPVITEASGRRKRPVTRDASIVEEVAAQILSDYIREFSKGSWMDVLAETVLDDEEAVSLKLLRINTQNPGVIMSHPLDYGRELFTPGLHSPNTYSIEGDASVYSGDSESSSDESDAELYPMKLARRASMTARAVPQFVQMKVKKSGLRMMLMDYYSRLPDELLETVCPFEELWRQYLEKEQSSTWFWMVVEGTIMGLAVLAPEEMTVEALHFSTLSVVPYANALKLFLEWVWTASECRAVYISLYSKLDEFNLHVLNRSIKVCYDNLGFKWRSVRSAYLPGMNITLMGYNRPPGIRPREQTMQSMKIRFYANTRA
jgi:hypothetical protein